MKKLLLHCCCAVCASSVIERLLAQGEYEITAYFSNSNIMPKSEYEKRRDALSEYIAKVCPNVLLIEDEYDNKRYRKIYWRVATKSWTKQKRCDNFSSIHKLNVCKTKINKKFTI